MVEYENERYKSRLAILYTLEYIDNKEDVNYVNSVHIDEGEPYGRYKKKSFDSLVLHCVNNGELNR